MITLATVGYGDILPVSATARTLATLEATVGTFYVAIIVAVFVGMYAAQRHE
jgi:voltage-gated potassium channel